MGCVFLDEIVESGAHIAQVALLPSMEVRLSHMALGLLVRDSVELTITVGARGKPERFELGLRPDQVSLRLRELAGQEESRLGRRWLDGASLWGNIALPTRRWESDEHRNNLRETDRLRVLARYLVDLAIGAGADEKTRHGLTGIEKYLSGPPF
jgi:hypothetical protein